MVYLDIFSIGVWVTIFSSSILLGLVITLLYTEDKGKVLTQLIGKTWNVLMATFGSGKIGLSIGSQSEKVLSVTILLAGMNQFYDITCSIYLTHLEARAKIQKYFRSFLVQMKTQMKTLKFASEIY